MAKPRTPEQTSRIMRAVKTKGTKPELIVRKYLFAHGFRYRLNHKRLPGHPDIVLRKYKTCVFVNGCFWHGHDNCHSFRLPHTNIDFWDKKITRTKARDKAKLLQLAAMGWRCITIWECQLSLKEREQTLQSLAYTLNKVYLADLTRKTKSKAIVKVS